MYVCIYIVILRQIGSLCHNSTVWLDTQDALSWDRNPPNFTLDFVSNLLSHFGYIGPLRDHDTLVYAFVCLHFVQSDSRVLNSLEEFCIMRVASVN